MTAHRCAALALGLLLTTPAVAAAPFDEGVYHTLTTVWQGPDKCLDIKNDGKKNNIPQLAACGAFTGQFWSIQPAGGDHVRLTTKWRGDDLCLDIRNDGKLNNRPQLAKCGNYAGQLWKMTEARGGTYRLTTKWRGDDLCLDVINDGKNTQLQLAKCGNYTGQFWKITATTRRIE